MCKLVLKKSFFLVRKFLQAYDLHEHKLRLLQRMEGMGGGTQGDNLSQVIYGERNKTTDAK